MDRQEKDDCPAGGGRQRFPLQKSRPRVDSSLILVRKPVKLCVSKKENSMASNRNEKHRPEKNKTLLYDARGVRVNSSPLSNRFVRFLLFFLLPYLVINGILFLLLTSAPKIDVRVADTNDYVSTKVNFTVKSLLPLKKLKVTMEGEEVEYEKNGSKYNLEISKNGTLYIEALALNGMPASIYSDIAMLDDTAPSIDEDSCYLEDGNIVFKISDSQSGVNYEAIYGETETGERVDPVKTDKEIGTIVIPMIGDNMTIYYEDMVGNTRQCSISATEVGSPHLEVQE